MAMKGVRMTRNERRLYSLGIIDLRFIMPLISTCAFMSEYALKLVNVGVVVVALFSTTSDIERHIQDTRERDIEVLLLSGVRLKVVMESHNREMQDRLYIVVSAMRGANKNVGTYRQLGDLRVPSSILKRVASFTEVFIVASQLLSLQQCTNVAVQIAGGLEIHMRGGRRWKRVVPNLKRNFKFKESSRPF